MTKHSFLFGLAITACAVVTTTTSSAAVRFEGTFDAWLEHQNGVSMQRLLANLAPADGVPGIVLASPSRQNPDYRYHWTRDAALVIDVLVRKPSADPKPVLDFIRLSRRQQLEPSAQGLGEPRYRVDGTADTLEWARPQYDGPALRALTIIRFLLISPALAPEDRALAIQTLQTDLEFVLRTWDQPCFDLWEELKGIHFYTQAAQAAALRAGAIFFASESRTTLANRLFVAAVSADETLESYWDPQRGYIRTSLGFDPRPGFPDYKDENLDTSVILAALHSETNRGILSFTDERLLATANALELAFEREYRINQHEDPGNSIGRFTDDVYYGGNPWHMTTAAFAELHYRVARALARSAPTARQVLVTPLNEAFYNSAFAQVGNLRLSPGDRFEVSGPIGKALIAALYHKGDSFLEVIRKYAGDAGELAEQFDRDAGVPVSAHDLTWSYASFLSATRERAR